MKYVYLTLQCNKEIPNLENSLRSLNEGEIMSGMNCGGCNKAQEIRKTEILTKAPNVLMVHVNRIGFNHNTYMPEKINSKFEFPEILDINPFSF
jgi:uncharacterized UBP type Zn finger protein